VNEKLTSGQGPYKTTNDLKSAIPDHIFERYSNETYRAYYIMYVQLIEYFRGVSDAHGIDFKGNNYTSAKRFSALLDKDKEAHLICQNQFNQIVGQAGAKISASKKTALRKIAFMVIDNSTSNFDITPILANQIIKKSLGRGVSQVELIAHFSTPGRTAANKSTYYAHTKKERANLTEKIELEIEGYCAEFNKISLVIRKNNKKSVVSELC